MDHIEPIPRLCEGLSATGIFGAGSATVARAPGRLDVMGGIADYTGSLVCELPLQCGAAVAVQYRDDGQLLCCSAQKNSAPVSAPACDLETVAYEFGCGFDEDNDWARYVLGCAWWIGQRADLAQGLSIAIDSDVPVGGGVASSAAIEVATMTALASLVGLEMNALELAAACQFVENNIANAPCGLMDQVVCTMGSQDRLLPILCQESTTGEPVQIQRELELPPGLRLVGLHCGISHDVSGDPYTETRVAAFMGKRILEDLGCPTDGYLARANSTVYEKDFAQDLPQAMTGEEFADQFGETSDSTTSVSPETVYYVRGATDHHVFEAERVRRFVKALSGGSSGDEELWRQAGALMSESHESYSSCAGLGHAATDKLVELLQDEHDVVYGAKITGGGCGGTVAILMKDCDEADEAVERVRQEYARQAGLESILCSGSSDGAFQYGAHVVEKV